MSWLDVWKGIVMLEQKINDILRKLNECQNELSDAGESMQDLWDNHCHLEECIRYIDIIKSRVQQIT